MKDSGQEYTAPENNQKRNEKKQFLKKKSKKIDVPAKPSKKYNYYIENFEEVKKLGGSVVESAHETSHVRAEPKA